MAASKSPEQLRAEAEIAEYSTYRAILPIVHDGALAYVPGHAVPVSNVEKYGYHEQGLVEKITGEEKTAAQDRARAVIATASPVTE
jgi:hypothetical protein